MKLLRMLDGDANSEAGAAGNNAPVTDINRENGQ